MHYCINTSYLKDWQAYKIVGRDLLCLNYNSLEMFIVLEDLIYVSTVLDVLCIWKITFELQSWKDEIDTCYIWFILEFPKSDPKGDLLIIILPYSVLYINRCFLFFFFNDLKCTRSTFYIIGYQNDD
jgi:hypothetical protein